jgi:hypothetical protein
MLGFPTKTLGTPTNRGKARRYNGHTSCRLEILLETEEGVYKDLLGRNLWCQILLDLKLALSFSIFVWQAANAFWRKIHEQRD